MAQRARGLRPADRRPGRAASCSRCGRSPAARPPEAAAISCCCWRSARCCSPAAGSGAHATSSPPSEYEPDAGPDPTSTRMRLRLAVLLESRRRLRRGVRPVRDPPEMVSSLLSDDLASIATASRTACAHYRAGRVSEALWWWQFSYVSSWGPGPAACCARCSRWWPTTGWTPSSRARRTRWPRPTRCSRRATSC